MRKKDVFASLSHFIGALASLVGTVVMSINTYATVSRFILSVIYGISVTFLFLSSGIYHALIKYDNEKSFWRRLDHSAIFIMIAGTYTPISFLYLPTIWGLSLIIFQWVLAIIGIIIKISLINLGRFLTGGIYLSMGWVAIFLLPLLLERMPLSDFLLLLGGGLAFTVGAIFYISEKKSEKLFLIRKHDLFHVFVLIGAAMHYFVVYNALM